MSNEQDTILEVEGISCPSCIRHVTSALTDIGGVDKVDVKVSVRPSAPLAEGVRGPGVLDRGGTSMDAKHPTS